MLITITTDTTTTTLNTTEMGSHGEELEVLFNGENTTITMDQAIELGIIATTATVATTEETNTTKEEVMTKETVSIPTIRVEYMGSVIVITETRLVELGMDKRSNLALLGKEMKYEEFAAKANKDLGVLIIARFREALAKKMIDATKVQHSSPLVASNMDPKTVEQNNSAVQWLLGTIDFERKVSEDTLNHMRVWRNPGNKQVAYVSFEQGFYRRNSKKCTMMFDLIGKATNKLEAGQYEKRSTYGMCKFR